jgi:hypothetical protein
MAMPNESTGGLNSTRQMLDDLDALMERMLALPMEEADPVAVSPKRPALAATLTMLPPLETTAPSVFQGPHASFAGMDLVEDVSTPPAPPSKGGEKKEDAVPPPVVVRRLDTILAPDEPLPAPRRTFILWRPLLWINQGYDHATRLLGPLGSLLRSSPGRLVLGAAGLVLLGIAAAWLTRDWLTWTR